MSTTPLAHSSVGASSMYRWTSCPGSVRQSQGIVSESSVYAQEGTEAHDYAAHRILAELERKPFQQVAPDNWSDDTLDAVHFYVDHARKLREEEPDAIQMVEQRFDLTAIHEGMFGTADLVTYYPTSQRLVVTDYKNGAGVLVEAEGNKQAMYYAVGAYLSIKLPVKTVEVQIVQPRHRQGGLKTAEYDILDILEFMEYMANAVLETKKPDALLCVGDWCKWCPAGQAFRCQALKDEVTRITAQKFNPLGYDPAELRKAYEEIPLVQMWVKMLNGFVMGEAKKGNFIPGYELEETLGNRKWTDDAETFFEKHIEEDPNLVTKKLKSPAQVEKLRPDLKPIVTSLTVREITGERLVKSQIPDGL